jgi:hypothetical protein
VGFEPAIPASERPQTHTLDRTVTGICNCCILINNICIRFFTVCEWILRRKVVILIAKIFTKIRALILTF